MLKPKYSLTWILLLTIFFVSVAEALPPPRPGLVDPWTRRFLTTGELVPIFPKEMRKVRPSPRGGAIPLAPARVGGATASPLAISTSGNDNVIPLVLLIDFVDKAHTQSETAIASLFFAAGPRDLSVKNYWEEVSYTRQGTNIPGRTFQVLEPVLPTPQVIGWLRAGIDFPTSVTLYSDLVDPAQGANLANIRTLIDNAVTWLDSPAGRAAWNVTFSQYRGPTGTAVQALIFVHPGFGAEDSGQPSLDVYSHQAALSPAVLTSDGTTVGDYITVPELQVPIGAGSPPLIGAGVIVHEMGHLFGLPDLYPTGATGQTGGNFSGVGIYDLMGFGMWGNNLLQRPDVPAHLSPWSKAELGWIVPQTRSGSEFSLILRPSEYFPDAHQVYPSPESTQWFLVENRQLTDTNLAAPPWLFDNFLPGSGVLIWHIDDSVIAANRLSNTVNNDNVFKGVDVEEANGRNLLGSPIVGANPNNRADFFGRPSDYFVVAGDEFSRTRPVPGQNETNSTPIVGGPGAHPPDFGDNVTLNNFRAFPQFLPQGTLVNFFLYDLVLQGLGGGGTPPAWKTFNVASTQNYPLGGGGPRGPMRSDDIVSLAFDSGNNIWMGSSDQGIFRFLGTRFEFLGSSEGLPTVTPGVSIPLSPISAMAFEADTGSMWVGTDRGIFKMRNAGAGFRVQSSFAEGSAGGNRLPVGANSIRALAVRRGFQEGSTRIGLKYAATPVGLVRIDDGNTDGTGDDDSFVILRGDATALAIDDNGTPESAADDLIWVGFADGGLYRSKQPAEGVSNADPTTDTDFKRMATLAGAPPFNTVASLAVDPKGIVWIGTLGQGIQAFDLGELVRDSQGLPLPNLRDPYDFDGNGNLDPDGTGVYLDFHAVASADGTFASNNVAGIAFQASTGLPEPVAWIGQRNDINFGDPGNFAGGASRFDANLTNNTATANQDERLSVFSQVPPAGEDTFGSSTSIRAVAADSAGNLWFASTVPDETGVFRFGNAGILSLDSSSYLNVDAFAVVTLQDDGLNTDNTVVNSARVFVTSAVDSIGLVVDMTETGPDTGIFTGTFGFTLGASTSAGPLPVVRVEGGTTVTVAYYDANPRGTRTASAVWKKVFPFEDSLFIDNFSCFIATAAYGSAMAPEVRTFRRFRDDVLVRSRAGRLLVACYYGVSPSLAAVIAEHPALRFAARSLLAPASGIAGFAVGTGTGEKSTALLLLAVGAALLLVRGGSARLRDKKRPALRT